jgi:hypothetical protein
MPVALLGLQAALATGTEPSFDGWPMQAGTHLRWAAAPQLGFPPVGYWLLRRVASREQKTIAVPRAVVVATAVVPVQIPIEQLPCRCECVPPPGCCRNRTCNHPCEQCGDAGTILGPGWRVGDKPGWGAPHDGGWQLWSQPFTRPVTATNWPAWHAGALDPAPHSAAALGARDVFECHERLHGVGADARGQIHRRGNGGQRPARQQCARYLVEPKSLDACVLLRRGVRGHSRQPLESVGTLRRAHARGRFSVRRY